MKDENDRYMNSLLPKKLQAAKFNTPKPKGEEYVLFDDIKGSLTGWGRMVNYKSSQGTPGAAFNELESVTEGHFVEGLKDGYCRSISAVSGQCAAGFHAEGIPKGKWVSYKSNGTFSHDQGLYEGSTCTQKIEIASFAEKISK